MNCLNVVRCVRVSRVLAPPGRRAAAVLAGMAGLALVAPAAAQTANWNVFTNGSWFAQGNWSPIGVPTAMHVVNIATGGTCTAGGSAASVSIRGGSTHDVVASTLACGGQVRVGDLGGAGTLIVRNGGIVNASSVLLNADGSSFGRLRIGNGFSAGVVNAPVNGGGPSEVVFNHVFNDSYTFAQPLSGSLSVIHELGTTTLSSPGTNYVGNTTVNFSTLRITNNTNFNSPIFIAADGALVLDIAQDVRLLQGLSGSGPVTVAGNAATARLAGNNASYAGAFSQPGGTRGMMWSSANAGSAAAAWDLSGQFAMIETPGAATVRLGALSGSNAATQLAAFTGTGLKTFEVGALGTSTTFAGSIRNISTFGGGGTNTVALHKVGTGTLTLSNPNTYTGATTVSAGTLRITNNFDFNSPIGVAAGAALVLDIAQDVRLLQGLSGVGPVTVAGNAATARLAGDNASYAGAFSLPAGTRGMMWSSEAAGSAAATWNLNGLFAFIETPSGAVVRLGALSGSTPATQLASFGGSGVNRFEVGQLGTTTSFAGLISDSGGGGTGTTALDKVGTGALTLTNNNTYTGGTTVLEGALHVTGSVLNTQVNSDGAIRGTGTLHGPTLIMPNGTLSPGAGPPGQIGTTGSVTLNGALRIDITGPAPNTGYDVLLNSGAGGVIGATGTLAFGTLSGTFTAFDKLFIVNNVGAGSLSGTFAGLPNGGANGTPVPALNGLGGFPEWRIFYGADQATNALTGGNDIALAPRPACVADVDDGTGSGTPDGGVTIDDLLFYLGIFDQGLLRADVDDGSSTGTPDGGVTIDDLLYYLFRFDSGC